MKLRLLVAGLVFCASAAAQTAPTVSIAVAAGNTPTITWDCQAATTCTASGSWTGTKANSGSQVVTAITDTATYVITATTNGKNFNDLSWTAPTKNTDGSALTDLAGYKVYRGITAANLTLLTTIASPTTLTYKDPGLAAGTYFYAVSAYNASGVESARSSVGSGTATAAQSASASVTLKVPVAATGLTVN